MAREVIPQPKLQPNMSQEIRSSWQSALLSRAAHKPLFVLPIRLSITTVGEE